MIAAARNKPARYHVDGPDVSVEHVDGLHALAAHLGVEVEAPGAEAAGADELDHRQRNLLDGMRKLVGVPAVLRIAAIGVDRTEDAERGGHRDLVLETVPRQCGVVRLDIDLDLLLQAVALQEAVHGRGVEVVLVLGGLVRLGLDQDRCPEADPVLVLDDQREEAPEIVELAPQVRCSAASRSPRARPTARSSRRRAGAWRRAHRAPAAAAQAKTSGSGLVAAPGDIARVAEQVGRAPQQLAAMLRLQPLQVLDRLGEESAVARRIVRFGHHVDVVEACRTERRAFR